MPKGPKGQKRPADTVSNAIKVGRIATGEEHEEESEPAKRKAGQSGAAARSAKLTPEQREEIARTAAEARWKKR